MIRGCVNLVNRHTVQFASHRRCDDERAVSEVLGVVMLLAMVITIMAYLDLGLHAGANGSNLMLRWLILTVGIKGQ